MASANARLMYVSRRKRACVARRPDEEHDIRAITDQTVFPGPIVIIGFGSIGKGSLPLILRQIRAARDKMVVIAPDDSARRLAELEGVRFEKIALRPDNYRSVLSPLIPGGFVVNLSVDVSSVALISLCRELGALYIDTCIEPWAGGYVDASIPLAQRTNYALREQVRAIRGDGPTAVVAHGANPGMVSHLFKRALVHLAADMGRTVAPTTREGWATLAMQLGVKGMHIAERDTQWADVPKQMDEFVNTWSIEGFVSEGLQPAELGWGTHERHVPPEAIFHETGCKAAIYLARPGAGTRVRSWTPKAGPIQGYLITHNESISIADYLTVEKDGEAIYRPTVHYAYHPCEDTILSLHELQGRNMRRQSRSRLMNDEIVDGMDELGVLLYGHAKNAYWYGSQLTIDQARAIAPYQNATGLQVTSAVVAGMIWAIENPRRGVVDADELDHDRILSIQGPYLGKLVGAYTDWTPLDNRRQGLFPEDIDLDDPWQFKNVIVR
jgi:homospermidine synthase